MSGVRGGVALDGELCAVAMTVSRHFSWSACTFSFSVPWPLAAHSVFTNLPAECRACLPSCCKFVGAFGPSSMTV